MTQPLGRRLALPIAIRLATAVQLAPPPAAAVQILDAADHAELSAEIPADAVSRIALAGDHVSENVCPDYIRNALWRIRDAVS